jgi:hypothetical protein
LIAACFPVAMRCRAAKHSSGEPVTKSKLCVCQCVRAWCVPMRCGDGAGAFALFLGWQLMDSVFSRVSAPQNICKTSPLVTEQVVRSGLPVPFTAVA